MTNTKNNDNKPQQPPAAAPLSGWLGYIPDSPDIRKSNRISQNTIRNSHPAPGNPNRDQNGGNKDSK